MQINTNIGLVQYTYGTKHAMLHFQCMNARVDTFVRMSVRVREETNRVGHRQLMSYASHLSKCA